MGKHGHNETPGSGDYSDEDEPTQNQQGYFDLLNSLSPEDYDAHKWRLELIAGELDMSFEDAEALLSLFYGKDEPPTLE